MPFMFSAATADLGILEGRLTAARAAALDELLAAAIPADLFWLMSNLETEADALIKYQALEAFLNPEIADILSDVTGIAGAAMRGTDGVDVAAMRGTDGIDLSTLETRLSDVRATKLDNLDNINMSLQNLLYEGFAYNVDDRPGITPSGTAANPIRLIDNDTGTSVLFNNNGEYVEIDFLYPTYIKKYRTHGDSASNAGNKYKIEAHVSGAWEACIINIPDSKADAWAGWGDFTTPRAAQKFRFTITTKVGVGYINQIELMGVSVGE